MYNNADSVTHNDTAICLSLEHCISLTKAKCNKARSLGPQSLGSLVLGSLNPWVLESQDQCLLSLPISQQSGKASHAISVVTSIYPVNCSNVHMLISLGKSISMRLEQLTYNQSLNEIYL